ncbi:TonB-dependent receptor [Pseudopedobacter saltans DSM 12145]|uniref:TonB-dependent receptor n=1 Tax=Pseudopedobacter saltans (strain ATCC 51119 / DSM 12145 / JCM 21818 / CCUG 39354 / LMG 10337 / NBRC 100064 / NCIMB 13643) TaxID=762903 RepID=F0S7J3_PSESL|nr:TonB-dependent receptor [Pseudopedobacter saltans]ADY52253.1 TonB-dependent receptor [Pseudopedobacter saltans DSM 12145]
MKLLYSIAFILLQPLLSYCQTIKDSINLSEVKVKAYLQDQPLISLPSSAATLKESYIKERNIRSLVPALNSISGVSMEERSPGSYRLSIRGSVLRSPFGVRNIKVYYDDFPLTDAGGNTYLNLIDQNTIRRIEILKGPDGSLFGANSGGVILLNSSSETDAVEAGTAAGSYGLFSQYINADKNHNNYSASFNQAYQRSDGYRANTETNRFFIQTQQKWRYNPNAEIRFSGFYSDMNYQTPGGLTLAQMQENPKGARANARELSVGIYNKSFFGGLAHETRFSPNFKHVISVSGITTDFKNPFFTNYETRKESYWALRTYLELKNRTPNEDFNWQWNLGWEYQHGSADIINHTNNSGVAGNVIAADRIKNETQFIFNRYSVRIGQRFKADASLSLNFGNVDFEPLPQSINSITGSKKFDPSLMPRISASYLINPNIAIRGIISRGYSFPTTAEIRANDARVNPDLEPETGWNYETGIRLNNKKQSLFLDFSTFYYRMNNAIVKRQNEDSKDYFLNAGGTKQKGIELQLQAVLLDLKAAFIKKIYWTSATTLSGFKFTNYIIGNDNYSGNILTGVPKESLTNGLNFDLKHNLSVFIQHQYNGKTSLNDAETVFADAYHLIQMRLNWKKELNKSLLNFYIGTDNLLDETYSLGNDINAFGNRYFNPAANRSFFAGANIKF